MKDVIPCCEMNSGPTWKLHRNESDIEEFIDVRRKVGNQIIRDYLLDNVVKDNKIKRIPGKLRGPKNEFKDLAKFLILEISLEGKKVRFLAEAGVYENLRIVAVDSDFLADQSKEDLIRIFTEALESPDLYDTSVVLSDDSEVR
ncbi:MAG: hypothetical protein ACFFE2_03100 [Candidatus Thorarchaeota archaeon]